MQVHLYFLSNPWMLFLWIPLFILLAFWYYQKTLPPVSKSYRILLLALRIVVFVVLLLLIFEPVLKIVRTRLQPARIAVLLDTSGSMQIQDDELPRLQSVQIALNSKEFNQWQDEYQLSFYQFSEDISSVSKEELQRIEADGKATDFEKAFSALIKDDLEERLDALLLFSDGIHNRGRSPGYLAENIGFPVYTCVVGNETEKPDVSVVRVLSHDAVFAEEETPLEVLIRGVGFGGEKATITVQKDDEILRQVEVILPEKGMEIPVTIYVTPETPGVFECDIIVPELPGESNLANNRQKVMMRVLKGKHKVMLIAAAPHPDVGMIKRIFKHSDHVDLSVRTFKSNNSFYEGEIPNSQQLKEQDVLILFHLPSQKMNTAFWNQLVNLIQEDEKPVLFMYNSSVNISRLNQIHELLPVKLSGKSNDILLTPQVTPLGIESPFFRDNEEDEPVQFLWQGLPPVFYSLRTAALKPESRVILTGRSITDQRQIRPLIISRHIGKQKSIAILGHHLHRWDLLAQGIGKSNQGIYVFFKNAVRWLSLREDVQPVQIQLDKLLYDSGEMIWAGVRVLDGQSEPVTNADVKIRLHHQDSERNVEILNEGNGLYQAKIQAFEGGEYTLFAEATLDHHSLGTDTSTFHLKPFQKELLHMQADPRQLKLLSQKTGGISAPIDSFDTVFDDLQFPRQQITTSNTIRLHHTYWMLVLLLLSLFIEWWLRKRKEML